MTDLEGLPKRERDKLERMRVATDLVDERLFKLGLQGLQRMTRSSVVELEALGQSAHNGALIKVERQLSVLGTMVERYVDRDPLFSMSEYVATLNRIWLLVGAARQRLELGQSPAEMIDVVGEARRTYTTRESLSIQPIGAWGWASDTGYIGVTIYFVVAEEPGTVVQATNAKPSDYFGTDPRSLLNMPVSDTLRQSIHDFAHGSFVLDNAKLSADGRLSLHRGLQVFDAPYAGARAYGPFAADTWRELVDRLRDNTLSPLSGGGSMMAYVEPAGFGPLVIDDKRSIASVVLTDALGESLRIEVELRAENNALIDNLEVLLGGGVPLPDGLFGRVSVRGGQLVLFPFTALFDKGVKLEGRGGRGKVHQWHLSLERVRKRSQRGRGR